MNNLNHCLHEGNLTRDPEIKYTNTGTPRVTFSVAVNKSFKRSGEWVDEVSYFDFVAWGKVGENISNYLHKGSPVRIVSESKQNRWEQEGRTRTSVSFVVKDITFLPSKKNNQGDSGASGGPAAGPAPGRGASYDQEDDIPF